MTHLFQWIRWAVASWCVCLAGCAVPEGGLDCANGVDDDNDSLVDCDDGGCALLPLCALCGNGRVEGDEMCDDGNSLDNDACSVRCIASGCGNGVREGDEACDDGNLVPRDGCSAHCTFTRCGDAIIDADEACDDGNRNDSDGCDQQCHSLVADACGNGAFDNLEQCEDGNTRAGDGCDAQCRAEYCGDGIVQPALGEACDDARDGPSCGGCQRP